MPATDFARRPASGEYADYYDQYLNLATESDIVAAIENQIQEFRAVLDDQPEENVGVLHEPYTWTIKQALGHVIDNERIFGYRAARFACGDPTDLIGYDQDAFVANVDYSSVKISELLDELEHIRRGNLSMYRRMLPEYWDRSGKADGKLISVRAIAYLLVGHLRHHLTVFEKRLAS